MTVNRGYLARTGFNHLRRHRPNASGVLHYDTFVQRIFSHSLTSLLFVFPSSCSTSIQVSLVANVAYDYSIDLVLIKLYTGFA
jgi:hypothetical protein